MPPSKNLSGDADNPQERPETCGWVVGFVDGEGSFIVSIFRSPKTKIGWQVFPEFSVSQGEKDLRVLELLKEFFGCGEIYLHKARAFKKKKWQRLYKYCVRNRKDLEEKIIPFFEKYPLRSTSKRNDFERFKEIIEMMKKGEHLTISGLQKIARIIQKMTHRKSFHQLSSARFLESSETLRRAEDYTSSEDRVRALGRPRD